MSERHTCNLCERTFRGRDEDDLVQKIKDHYERTHSIQVDKGQVSEEVTA